MNYKHNIFLLVASMIVLSGCQPQTVIEAGYQPPIVPVRISVNSRGEVGISAYNEIIKPIGTFDLSDLVSVDTIRSQYANNILIVRVDNEATVYQLEEGNQFDIIFNDENTLYKVVAFYKEAGGDIILELESVYVSSEPEGSESNSSNYSCDDLNGVKLSVGESARVVWPKVNLRAQPVIPEVWDANIVAQVVEGADVTIIGGPECAYEGTWWEVQTEGGITGWSREFVSDGYLLSLISNSQTPEPDILNTNINPTQILNNAFEEIDQQFINLVIGNLAFNKPEKMNIEDVAVIELIISPLFPASELATQLVEQGNFVTSTADPTVLISPSGEISTVETSQIEITPLMKAVLLPQDSEAFMVKEMHDNAEQVISSVETTTWRWSVTAKKEGSQTLELVIYQLVKYDGKEFWHEVETYKADIVVEVTLGDRVKALDWYWIAGFIVTLVGAIIGVWKWLDERKKKAEESKPPVPVRRIK